MRRMLNAMGLFILGFGSRPESPIDASRDHAGLLLVEARLPKVYAHGHRCGATVIKRIIGVLSSPERVCELKMWIS